MVVDRDPSVTQQLDELLQLCNYEVIQVHSSENALSLVKEIEFDVLIVSLDMPGGGFDLGQKLKAVGDHEDTPLSIITSAQPDHALLMEAQFYGALFLHHQPFDEVELMTQIATMVRLKHLRDALKKRMEELDKLASTDPLTGLYNRRMFLHRMEEELSRAARTAAPICLMYIDVDRFKFFNDEYGHDTGDAVLQQVARVMKRILRRNDVLGRMGGDEFVILLPDTPGAAGRAIAERLRQRVENATITHDNIQHSVAISIGLFHAADPVGLSADDLVRNADEGLYAAKEAGRNCVVYRGDNPG